MSSQSRGHHRAMAFKHKRLEHPWQLRLVELLPRTTNNRNETIRCRILLVPGADAGIIDPHYDKSHDAKRIPYIALSYCWGNPNPTHKIELDGMEYEVGSNLFEYLIQRRETSASVMFWIDAFCIDQSCDKESKAERSAQVPRMTSIYMNADAIEIWLGPEGDNSSLAMDELNRLAKKVSDKIAKKRTTNLLRSFPNEDAIELAEALGGPAREYGYLAAETVIMPFVASAILNLWTRPWWGRLWVVQEATVPGSKKVFRCGDRSISWQRLMVAAASLRSSFTERLVPVEDAWTVDGNMPLFATTLLGCFLRTSDDPMKLLLVQQKRVGKQEDPLIHLLPMSRGLQASDNRDRVYALIGMATDISIAQFTVDYAKSEEEVYREVTTYLIRTSPHGNNLDVLGEAHHFESPKSKSKSSLPSWVPDWRIQLRTVSLLKTVWDVPKVVGFKSRLIYAASGLDTAIMSKHWGSGNLIEFKIDEMHICGIRLDKIEELIELPVLENGRKISNDKPPIGSKKTWKRLRKVIPFHLGPIYRTRRYGIESIYDAFRRTVSADIQYHGYTVRTGLNNPTRGAIMSDPGDSQLFTGNDYTTCYGRKLAITHGRSMGLVSAAAQVGDEIFVLAGGQVLHTLRPKGDCYTYLGDCYLHGFMDGEALQRLENGRAKLERVRIC